MTLHIWKLRIDTCMSRICHAPGCSICVLFVKKWTITPMYIYVKKCVPCLPSMTTCSLERCTIDSWEFCCSLKPVFNAILRSGLACLGYHVKAKVLLLSRWHGRWGKLSQIISIVKLVTIHMYFNYPYDLVWSTPFIFYPHKWICSHWVTTCQGTFDATWQFGMEVTSMTCQS